MKFNYNIIEDPPKNNPFNEEEMIKFIASKESFEPMPYLDSQGHITVGYGKLVKKLPEDWTKERKEQELENYTNNEFKKEYPNGITKEQAYETLKTSYQKNWGYMEAKIKQEGINVDSIPEDVKLALKLFSYGGIGHANDSDGAIKYLKTAEEKGYDEASRKELAGKIYREKETGGVATVMSLYRAMIEGKYDYDSDRKNLNNEKWNVYSNQKKYENYNYTNYEYANSKVEIKEEMNESSQEYNKEKPNVLINTNNKNYNYFGGTINTRNRTLENKLGWYE